MRKVLFFSGCCVFFFLSLSFAPALQAAPLSFVVDSTLDEVDDNIGDDICHTVTGFCTLRAAIQEANANNFSGDTINLPAGTYILGIAGDSEDLSATGDLDIDHVSLHIVGAGSTNTIVDAADLDNVMNVLGGEVNITGLTFQNGVSGIYANGGDVNLTQSVIKNNSDVGLMLFAEGSIVESTIQNNGKAGIFITPAASVTIEKSSVLNNFDSNGGGISVMGSLNMQYSTVSGNTAFTNGGGVYANVASNVSISNSTIANNTATNGSGIYNNNATLFEITSVLIDNDDCAGNALSVLHYNLDSGSSCVSTNVNGNLYNLDPLLGALQDNGGYTHTYALLAGSPAIDSGPACASTTDQRGATAPQNSLCDLGAYEYHKFQIGFAVSSQAQQNTEDYVTITVQRSAVGDFDLGSSVSYATADGTALAGLDYTSTSGTLSWETGDFADQTIQVPVLGNVLADGTKTFTIALSGFSESEAATYSTNTISLTLPQEEGDDPEEGEEQEEEDDQEEVDDSDEAPLAPSKDKFSFDPETNTAELEISNTLSEAIRIDSVETGSSQLQLDTCSGSTLESLGASCLLRLRSYAVSDYNGTIIVAYTRLSTQEAGTLSIPLQISGYSTLAIAGSGGCSLNKSQPLSSLFSFFFFASLLSTLSFWGVRMKALKALS